MSSVTTDDMNEVIAIFDGWELVEREVEMSDFTIQKVMCFVKYDNRRYHFDLKYHTSWDALMPVIKKIREMHTDLLLTLKNGVGAYIKAAGEMNRGLISCDISKAHAGVHKFIIWYNQQTTTNDQL